jgi:sporulation protein YlmC with PRC-barrel domain
VRIQISRELLDRQLVDLDGRLVGKVDDVEFALDADGMPYLRTLLSGPGALGQRVGGRLGRMLVLAAERFVTDRPVAPLRIPYALVDRVDSAVWLRVRAEELAAPPVEEWLRRNLIDRIPGADRASG